MRNNSFQKHVAVRRHFNIIAILKIHGLFYTYSLLIFHFLSP